MVYPTVRYQVYRGPEPNIVDSSSGKGAPDRYRVGPTQFITRARPYLRSGQRTHNQDSTRIGEAQAGV